ncbi:MAG: CvpA family protein [Bacteroidota bacterium]
MTLDIMIGVPIILAMLSGLRDGLVRKTVALILMVLTLFVGQLYMHDVGNFLIRNSIASPESAARRGFYCIFFGVGIVQSILYRFITGNFKIGGFIDRIGGTLVGFVQGVVFTSIMLMMMSLTGFPDRSMIRDSQFYKPIVNIAPELLDAISSVQSEEIDRIKKMNSPDVQKNSPNKIKSKE